MDDRPVLDVGAGADANWRVIAANDAAEPDVGIGSDLDITDYDGAGRYKGARVDPRQDVAVRQDDRPHRCASSLNSHPILRISRNPPRTSDSFSAFGRPVYDRPDNGGSKWRAETGKRPRGRKRCWRGSAT